MSDSWDCLLSLDSEKAEIGDSPGPVLTLEGSLAAESVPHGLCSLALPRKVLELLRRYSIGALCVRLKADFGLSEYLLRELVEFKGSR